MTLNPMFLWDIPSVRMRAGIHFLADLGSTYGYFSIAGVGITGLFYPMGISSYRETKEDGVEISRSRISPFFQASITPVKFSATFAQTPQEVASKAKIKYFNALILETSLGAGVDYPFGQDFVGFIGAHYRFAALKDQETSVGSISYSGIMVMLGVMTNFF